jgi:hypothetical protein
MQMKSAFIGVVAGLLFFGHAMINNSHAWPLIWPAVAGAAAVLAAHRQRSPGYAADLATAALAGLIAGATFFAATAFSLSGMGLLKDGSLAALSIAAGLGVLSALVLGGLAHPLASKRV